MEYYSNEVESSGIDFIWGVQDGRSSSLTAPNGPSQQDVIVTAHNSSGVSSSDLACIEMHGTGTPLGDPIELGAICAVFKVLSLILCTV